MANKRTLMDFFGAKNDREQQGDKAKQGDDGSEPTTSSRPSGDGSEPTKVKTDRKFNPN